MGHPFNPDSSGYSCDLCPLPEAHPDHSKAPTVMEQATRGFRHGDTYDVAIDYDRLNAQSRRVFNVMAFGTWHTLTEVAATTGDPEASVSARLRDFRKADFGSMSVDRRRRAGGSVWEYRLLVPANAS